MILLAVVRDSFIPHHFLKFHRIIWCLVRVITVENFEMMIVIVLVALLVVIGSTIAVSVISDNEELKYYSSDIDRCTTIVVGAKASLSGPMNTHTADCSDCDFRLNYIPPQDWPEGSMRPLYAIRGPYPNTVSPNRGKTWHPDNLEGTPEQLAAWGKESSVTGYVPQVPHTYGLYEAGYAIMNEHQVAIGESTCAARFFGVPVTYGGKAHIEINEMTRLGLERGKTARETIQVMGDMAVKYGFYGSDWSGGDMSLAQAGEALTVIDKTEAWVFHVLCDDTGASAIWVAQRVPDDHVSSRLDVLSRMLIFVHSFILRFLLLPMLSLFAKSIHILLILCFHQTCMKLLSVKVYGPRVMDYWTSLRSILESADIVLIPLVVFGEYSILLHLLSLFHQILIHLVPIIHFQLKLINNYQHKMSCRSIAIIMKVPNLI